jgi:cardiolipin synthase
LARRWKAESDFGKAIDPLADKTLMILSYYVFAQTGLIPVVLAALVILRDVSILGVVIWYRFKKISLQINPLFSSKVNTTLQLIYILVILFCKCFVSESPSLIFDFCAFAVCASTVFSAFEYIKEYFWIKNAACNL